jgi:mitochondrial cardiolipin hydrolase
MIFREKGVGAIIRIGAFLIALSLHLQATRVDAFFSPDDHPTKKILELICHSRRSIVLAVYFFTDGALADALIQAHARHVDIKVILDSISIENPHGKADILARNGIEVFIFSSSTKGIDGENKWSESPLMHNKYAVFDNDYVETGSFNWTEKACIHNRENIVLIKDHGVCALYRQDFEKLLSQSVRYDPISTARAGAASRPDNESGKQTSVYDPAVTCCNLSPSMITIPADNNNRCVSCFG